MSHPTIYVGRYTVLYCANSVTANSLSLYQDRRSMHMHRVGRMHVQWLSQHLCVQIGFFIVVCRQPHRVAISPRSVLLKALSR